MPKFALNSFYSERARNLYFSYLYSSPDWMKSGCERAARTPVKNVIKESRGGFFFSKKELSAFQGLVSFVMLTTFPSLEEPKAVQGEKSSQLVPNRRKKVNCGVVMERFLNDCRKSKTTLK